MAPQLPQLLKLTKNREEAIKAKKAKVVNKQKVKEETKMKKMNNEITLNEISDVVKREIDSYMGNLVNSNTVRDSNRATGSTFETNMTRENADINAEEAWSANLKRTYDLTQSWDFELARRSAAHFDAMMTDTRTHIANVRKVELETLQNGSHGANLVNTQSTAHRDIATDRTWNVDEVAQLVAKNGMQADAIAAAIVKSVSK